MKPAAPVTMIMLQSLGLAMIRRLLLGTERGDTLPLP
jgi:hypothetical protein